MQDAAFAAAPLHLLKMAVGVGDIDELRRFRAARLKERGPVPAAANHAVDLLWRCVADDRMAGVVLHGWTPSGRAGPVGWAARAHGVHELGGPGWAASRPGGGPPGRAGVRARTARLG